MTEGQTHQSDAAEETTQTADIVAEEQSLLEAVKYAVESRPAPRAREDYNKELLRLRENLAEERLPEDRASIVEQMTHIRMLQRQLARSARGTVDLANPYFGHVRLIQDGGRRLDVMIGRSTFIYGNARIVDWRNAPVASVFYRHRTGDDYVMVIDGQELEGEVAARRMVSIDEGELLRVADADEIWVRAEGTWRKVGDGPVMRGGEGKALRPRSETGSRSTGDRRSRADKHLPEIASLLDPEQYRLITEPSGGLIAISGSAGSGKTTVALHRAAYLAYAHPRRFPPSRTLVLVYSRALANYISRILPDLDLGKAQILTVDSWMRALVSRLFKRLPRRRCESTPALVSRFKHHASMLEILAQAAEENQGGNPVHVFDEIFTSRSWLGRAVERHAPGQWSSRELDEIHLWCSQLHAVRDAGAGANPDDFPELDAEDDAILLRLHQLLVGPLTKPGRKKLPLAYRHLLIDEVQDLSPVELAVAIETVEPEHAVTLAGDTAQRLTGDNDFQDWSYVLEAIGIDHVAVEPLTLVYRSTGPIMSLAQHVLGPIAPDDPPNVQRDGEPVRLFKFAGRGEAVVFLGDLLSELLLEEPNAYIALLTARPVDSEAYTRALERAGVSHIRRVVDQDFSFAPGVEVTEVRQTKGLEFDYVVLLDVDDINYPATDASRHVLHVGITRAAHMCWLVTTRSPSPLLPESLVDGTAEETHAEQG